MRLLLLKICLKNMCVLNTFDQGCICYTISSKELYYSKNSKTHTVINEQNFLNEAFKRKMHIVFRNTGNRIGNSLNIM